MLNRQKLLLCLLDQSGGKSSCNGLVRHCFLLSKEVGKGNLPSLYEFLPYNGGPYSFTIGHEMNNLVRDGFVWNPKNNCWALTERAGEVLGAIPSSLHQKAQMIVGKYGRLSEGELLEKINRDYEWYTTNRDLKGTSKEFRPIAKAAVYTIGYEGWSIDGFLNMLLRSGIQALLDVRFNPIARSYGFHKSTLSRLCENIGVEYIHIKELGVPSFLRRTLATRADYINLLNIYDNEILPEQNDALLFIRDIITAKPAAVMCMEAEAGLCHRSRVAYSVSKLSTLPVIHLKKTDA